MSRKTIIATALVLALLAAAWFLLNPPGRFGICFFGLTTFSSVPRFGSDLQVRSGGAIRTVPRTHDLRREDIDWLLNSAPEVLIIGIGWNGAVKPDPQILKWNSGAVEILQTGDATARFNVLRKQGRKVAIHVHGTC